MLVVDASVVVAGLIDVGDDGTWAEAQLLSGHLAAPHLMPVEAANVLRRAGQTGAVSDGVTSLAHADLLDLTVELFPYEPVAERIWELRHNLAPHDAWYVAVAESLSVPLATLDRRLARAPGPRCEFTVPPTG